MTISIKPGGNLEWARCGTYPKRLREGEGSGPMVIANRPIRRAILNLLHGHLRVRRSSVGLWVAH